MQSYGSVFNSQLSVSILSIEVFEKLISRVLKLHKVKPIRDDEQCLLLMQALNKFRELIEKYQSKDAQIASEKEILLNQVTKMLNKELASLSGLDPS